MNKRLLITLLFAISYCAINAQPTWLWANAVTGTQMDRNNAIATDSSGNSYSTGSYQGTIDFDPSSGTHIMTSAGDLDGYILKFDATGNFGWSVSLGDAGTDEGMSIAVDKAGYVYATGHFQQTVDFDPGAGSVQFTSHGGYDIYVVKFDPSGTLVWAGQIGGTSTDEPLGITTDNESNVYVTGYFSGTVDFDPSFGVANLISAGSQDAFVVKLDSGGNYKWADALGGTTGDRGYGVAVDANSSVYVTGYFAGTADLDPTGGTFNVTSAGSQDAFICKLDSSGGFAWAGAFGSTGGDRGYSISTDQANNVYVTGQFSGTVDFDPSGANFNMIAGGGSAAYVSKFNSDGNFIRAKSLNTSGNGTALGQFIIVDPVNADVVVSGGYTVSLNCDPLVSNFTLAAAGLDDAFIVRFDSAGNFNYGKTMGGTNSDYCGSISMSQGFVYIGGTFHSPTMMFDSLSITNAVTTGFSDIYVAKLDNMITLVKQLSNEADLKIYPSPANDVLRIVLPENCGKVSVCVTDISGKIVTQKIISESSSEIETATLRNGVYWLTLNGDKINSSNKFSVLH